MLLDTLEVRPYIPAPWQLRLPYDDRPPRIAQIRRERKKKRRQVLFENCPRCSYCGCDVTERPHGKGQRRMSRATIDHVLPESRGGTNDAENVVLACWGCNTVKGCRTPEEWAADILAVVAGRRRRVTLAGRLRALAAAVVAFLPFVAVKGGAH